MYLLNNMFAAFGKADRMNTGACFHKWASQNKKQRMYLVCARIVSNFVERQQTALRMFQDQCRRFYVARKVMGMMMMRTMGEKDGK
jgi:hypothetical protein